MTRLRDTDIGHITAQLGSYDDHLKRITGASLRQIACSAAGVDETLIVNVLDGVRFAAVPITGGLGVIGGFSEAVAAIVSHLGFEARVTGSRDVAGIVEGHESGADILFLADDDNFVAITFKAGQLVDNSRATALGFVAGLELMSGGLAGKSVLVLGCGPVGVAGARTLIARGACVSVCDVQQQRAIAAMREIRREAPDRVRLEDTPLAALNRYELIFDASNTGDFIESVHLTPSTMVAAPGMPCAVTADAMEEHRDRIIHDSLEIGTATMAIQAVAHLLGCADTQKPNRE